MSLQYGGVLNLSGGADIKAGKMFNTYKGNGFNFEISPTFGIGVSAGSGDFSTDEPSLTLTCSPAQKQTERCHPDETRPFTVREYARIQTFPDDWKFAGSVTQQYKQIGNAVPVNLGKEVGYAIVKFLNKVSK